MSRRAPSSMAAAILAMPGVRAGATVADAMRRAEEIADAALVAVAPHVEKRRLIREAGLAEPAYRAVCWELTLPLRTYSEANGRDWQARSRRTKEAFAAWDATRKMYGVVKPALPCDVVLTRLGGRALDDDNLRQSMKAVRDAVAAWLGLNDRDPLIRWEYAGLPGGPWGVRVRVGPRQG